jgi:hypothetical protein
MQCSRRTILRGYPQELELRTGFCWEPYRYDVCYGLRTGMWRKTYDIGTLGGVANCLCFTSVCCVHGQTLLRYTLKRLNRPILLHEFLFLISLSLQRHY